MKHSIFTIVIAIAATILGCQNSPTDPAISSAASAGNVPKASYPSVRILLNGTPSEPYPNSGLVFDIRGFADYSMVRVSGENLFNLHIQANATLTPRSDDQFTLTLASSSENLVSISEEGVTFREVRYVFPERNDRLALLITFQITTDNVEVADMALDFVE